MTRPGAVADDADLAVELDVVEALRLGLRPRAGRPRPCPRTPRGPACRKSAFSSRVTLPSSASRWPSPSWTSGFTSTSEASSSTKTSHSFLMTSFASSATSAGKPVAATISAAFASSTPICGSIGDLGERVGVRRARPPRSPRRPRRWRCRGSCGWRGRPGRRSSTPRRCPRPARCSTRWTVWPLMSMPRMSLGLRDGLVGVVGELDAAGLAAATGLTWALTTTRPPSCSAAARRPRRSRRRCRRSTGTPCLAKSSFAWYSIRSTGSTRPSRFGTASSRRSRRVAVAVVAQVHG